MKQFPKIKFSFACKSHNSIYKRYSIILNINICILKGLFIGLAKGEDDSMKWIEKPTGERIEYRVGGLWDTWIWNTISGFISSSLKENYNTKNEMAWIDFLGYSAHSEKMKSFWNKMILRNSFHLSQLATWWLESMGWGEKHKVTNCDTE